MSGFRSTDHILQDFQRLQPDFRRIEHRNDLLQLLSDDPVGDATAAVTGSGPSPRKPPPSGFPPPQAEFI